MVQFQKIRGKVQSSRKGLRCSHENHSTNNPQKDARKAVSASIRKDTQDKYLNHLYTKDYKTQCNWFPLLDKAMAEDLTWQRMVNGYTARFLKFILNLRANTLPSPSNMAKWKYNGYASCGLCGKQKATIAHIMNFCPWVHTQNHQSKIDRYTWRHHCVLRVLINHLSAAIDARSNNIQRPCTWTGIKFVKEGAKFNIPENKPPYGLLSTIFD